MTKKFIFIFTGLLALFILSLILFQSFGEKENIAENIPTNSNTKTAVQTIIPAYPADIQEVSSFAGEVVPQDIFYVREYLDRELTINTYFHSSTILMLKKANRWFPVIEPILAENNIPSDFKYLALIESGLENVTSPAGAKGFWQFLKHTAHEYGLEVNSDIDERYNVEKSTAAACRYLNKSYEKYKNWTLVAAAYNAGNKRITDALEKQKVDNYYDLALNQETARYVFRIIAIKTIFENPGKYHFYPDEMFLYPPIPTQSITVTHTIKDLVDFAHQNNINYKTLKYFNPWLLDDKLPNRTGRTYLIKIPVEGSLNYSTLMQINKAEDILNPDTLSEK